ncbi:DUF2321 domain-containing protein [uncultured Desulfovibrio sp.]|uniref:DUF2321 domain-containing protein n=1 Tax=uncultured Desulfovibrio sp. TaxID=167968 RepID=UPI002608FA1F|nr:DUF2321 domain-containing protein [uncultured Desulfovibrio sp.]
MSDSYYDVAQICANGHVVNNSADSVPQSNQNYCTECGAATIMACPSCDTAIRGQYYVPGIVGGWHYCRPAYCYNCGQPYPWTTSSLDAANELADELESLTLEEREQLKNSFPDLLRNTPKSAVAEIRFKKIIKKVGSDAYDGLKTILVDVVSETVKKSLFGG